MTDTAAGAASTPRGAQIDDWGRRDRIAGWVLAGAWTALLVAALLTGHRVSDFDRLEHLVAAGEVTEVEVVGGFGDSEGWQGWAGVEVRWREGWTVDTAHVTEASDDRQAARARREGDADRAVVVGSVEAHLSALDPDVRFTRGGFRSSSFEMGGWQAPGWVGLVYVVLLGATLVLNGGPRPWRATPWAWGWLILLVPPYGIAAYLLAGGPTGLLRPRDPTRVWLTGGWAFLLALLLGGGSAAT
ncbi:hypothetical protein [Nocardioides sediminis]|uniref:hypothetical protein n=1 Tax=Nocardioides sediminis TaxID=433648 RepID=UPI000D31864F|nr:hypothetical protein [Nocardioides sediminis]